MKRTAITIVALAIAALTIAGAVQAGTGWQLIAKAVDRNSSTPSASIIAEGAPLRPPGQDRDPVHEARQQAHVENHVLSLRPARWARRAPFERGDVHVPRYPVARSGNKLLQRSAAGRASDRAGRDYPP
jgi:hypothetical protein